ncbi:MAG: hypothetical protein E6I80_22075 [Chloroflexi bacterium]|nr:MAG: hypothetical protein E6I80_22075 [Chloroflexota bacterium]
MRCATPRRKHQLKYDLERIFDKFYRVLGTQRITGSGLGLAVCKGLVEAHRGRIWAENRDGGGAVFRFTLPITKTEPVGKAEDESK